MTKHCAYNTLTGEIICCETGNRLKKMVAEISKYDKENFGYCGSWRFCHDGEKKWRAEGLPK